MTKRDKTPTMAALRKLARRKGQTITGEDGVVKLVEQISKPLAEYGEKVADLLKKHILGPKDDEIATLRAELAQAKADIATRKAGFESLSQTVKQLAAAREEIERLKAKWGDGSSWIPEAVLRAERAARERAEHDSMTQTRRAIGLEEELILVRGDMSRLLSSVERAEARVSDMETDLRLIRKSITIEQVRSVFVGRDAILAARKSEPAKAEEESK